MPGLEDIIRSISTREAAGNCGCDSCRAERATDALLPEAVIARLRERAALYRAVHRFKVGDIVKAFPDSAAIGGNRPHIVVEISTNAEPAFGLGKTGTNSDGRRLDMRVMTIAGNDQIAAFWVESFDWTHWSEADAKAAAPDADGWIKWYGGECPVPDGTRVDVRHRDGAVYADIEAHRSGAGRGFGRDSFASGLFWHHDSMDGDIVAYRLHVPTSAT